ncbi:hypothetical protein KAFR_0E00710 [Kazachstania africana CBS 2517]|uniref:Elongator complex protein 4 n=1 Tax=Kazachstania africana (strain ATCC 22294 / BCRC 22015 / CBS 2517 / CECT 1963 / NBRC 1671 / NRRL Y-8276) TaxID=1071382 RepID=H2AV25_KAZAF|nr:hypothetical protein KAFR_0E00710 [Kazachstania africana CBS 2517]CCF58225.1 hypothetical protein KAFR_0E00710 [Kazachstania africana CBS 2517]
MSFRKRGEALNGGERGVRTLPGGRPLVNRAIPSAGNASMRAPTDRMTALNLRGRAPPGGSVMSDREPHVVHPAQPSVEQKQEAAILNHPGVRPSPVSSHLVTSTGSEDLDKILTHMGLPLGNSLLIEEQSTTEFNSILCRLFTAQSIMYNRAEGASHSTGGNTHLIALTLNQDFAKELPGVYKGSRKEMKKSKIAEEQSKISVTNLNEQKSTPSRYKDLKIAWKYKLADEKDSKNAAQRKETENEYQHYTSQFDITSRLIPAPSSAEITFISPVQPVISILSQIEQTIKKHPGKLVRIVIPSFLHPAMYPPKSFKLSSTISLLHGLRSIIKKNENNCVLLATLSSDIISNLLRVQIENLFDSIVNLEPFPQEMLQFLEAVYKSQPNKVQHGLIHILKLPIFSDRGEMRVSRSEWAFRNGRKRFEIEEWSIPVEDNDDSNTKSSAAAEKSHAHSDPNQSSKSNTKISLEY